MQFSNIITTRQTGGLHLAYKAGGSSGDLSLSLSLAFKPIAVCHPQPLEGALGLPAALKRVPVFFLGNLVHRYIMGFLFLYVLPYGRLVQADRAYVMPLCPEVAVPELVLQVRVPVEYHQAALPLQVSHELRHAVLRRYARQQVDVVGHQMPLDDLHSLVAARLAAVSVRCPAGIAHISLFSYTLA